MTIYEQLIAVCASLPDKVYTAAELRLALQSRFGTNPGSVLPSDYSYNRWNKGLAQLVWRPLFVRIGGSEYRYVGPSYAYTGLVYAKAKGAGDEEVVGEWLDGAFTLYAQAQPHAPGEAISAAAPTTSVETPAEAGAPISRAQLDRLYEEYTRILEYEVGVLKCKPTETRHLIGRLGELFCARKTNGTLAARVNQPGFDVITGDGRHVSVKTTAQVIGFVSISAKTLDRVDDLMVLQYRSGDFHVLYFGEIGPAIAEARRWNDAFELDLKRATQLGLKHSGMRCLT